VAEDVLVAGFSDDIFGPISGDFLGFTVPEHDPAVTVGQIDSEIKVVQNATKRFDIERKYFGHGSPPPERHLASFPNGPSRESPEHQVMHTL